MNATEPPRSETPPTNPRRGAIPAPIAESYAKLGLEGQKAVESAFLSAEGDPTPEPAFPAPAEVEVETSTIEAEYAGKMAGLLANRDNYLKAFETRVIQDLAGLQVGGPSKHSLMLSALSAQRAVEALQKAKERAIYQAHAEAGIAAAKAKAETLRLAGGSELEAQLIEAEAAVQYAPPWKGDLRALKGRVYDLKTKLAREAAMA